MSTPAGQQMKVGFEVTDTTREVLSVKKAAEHGSMTVFSPDFAGRDSSKIITDSWAIEQILQILAQTDGLTIEVENGSYVIDAVVFSMSSSLLWAWLLLLLS